MYLFSSIVSPLHNKKRVDKTTLYKNNIATMGIVTREASVVINTDFAAKS